MVKKSWFGDMHHVLEVNKQFTSQLCNEFDQHLKQAARDIIGKNPRALPGEPENFVQQISGMNLIDGFSKMYVMLRKLKYEACKMLPATANLVNFSDITVNALSVIQKDQLMSRIFHILLSTAPLIALKKDDISVLTYLGFKKAIEEMVEEQESAPKRGKAKQSKASVPKGKCLNTNFSTNKI